MPRRMSAGIEQMQARLRLPIPVAQIPLQSRIRILVVEVRHAGARAEGVHVLTALHGYACVPKALQVAGVVIMQVRQDHMPYVADPYSDVSELALEQVFIANHRRRHPKLPELLLPACHITAVMRMQAGIEQHPAAIRIEQISADRLAQDEACATVACRNALRQNLEAAQQYEKPANARLSGLAGGHGIRNDRAPALPPCRAMRTGWPAGQQGLGARIAYCCGAPARPRAQQNKREK